MLFISIINLIVASVATRLAIFFNYISPKLLSRLAIIFLLYFAFIFLNSLYFNNIEGVETKNFLVWLDNANIFPLLAITPIFSKGINSSISFYSFESIFTLIVSIIISFLFITFLLDGFHLSKNKIIKILQLSCFFIISFLILYYLYVTVFLNSVECSSNLPSGSLPGGNVIFTIVTTTTSAADPKTINMTSTVSMNAEGAKLALDAGASVIKNIGLGASIGATAAATAKAVANTGLSPVGKVAAVAAGAVVSGTVHLGVVTSEQIITSFNSKNTGYSGSDTPPSPSSPFSANSPNEELFILDLDSPVGLLLSSILTLNIISLFLLLALAFILFFKLLLSSNLELKWLDSIVTPYYSSKVKYILNKLISSIQKASVINIILVMFILIISGMGSLYLLIKLIANFEAVVQSYLKSTGR